VVVGEEQRLAELEGRAEELEARLQSVERDLRLLVGLRRPAPRVAPPPVPARAPEPLPEWVAVEEAPAAPPRRGADLEELVGGRLLAGVGAVAVVAGLALLLALGISRGWIGEEARTLAAGVFSLALLGAGAWLHERRGRTQAARATAATGVCGLFMSLTVAAPVYALIPTAAGLGLAFAVGALATWLAVRWSSRLVGALGIAGAVLAPVLVQAPASAGTTAFEAIAVGSAVTVLLRERWDWLGLAVFALSAPQWLVWLFDEHSPWAVLLVLSAFGALYALAALGFELRAGADARLRPAPAFLVGASALTLAVAGWLRLKGLGHHDLAIAWLAALGAAHLGGGLAAYRARRVSQEIALLGFVLAAVLVDVAFSLTVGGVARCGGFALAAVGYAALVRRRGGRESLLAQLGLGGHVAIAAMQALHDVDASQLLAPGAAPAAVGGLVAVAAACLVSARLAEAGQAAWRVALDATGLVAVGVVALLTLDGPALTIAWAAEAVALARIAAQRDDAVARVAAVAHLLAAAVFALADQAQPAGLVDGTTALGAAALGVGAVAAACLLVAMQLRRDDPLVRGLLVAAPLAMLYLTSLAVVALAPAPADGGVVQQGQLELSALWGLAGVGGLVLGLRRRVRALRLGALGLLGLTAAKVFLYDLAALTSVYRVGSFLALGLLLLAGALAYQRMRPEDRDA
jgi:hypothetical protein